MNNTKLISTTPYLGMRRLLKVWSGPHSEPSASQVDYLLDLDQDILIQYDTIRDIILLEQKVDFPRLVNSDRQKSCFVTSQPGFVRRGNRQFYNYQVYVSEQHRFFYDSTGRLVVTGLLSQAVLDSVFVGCSKNDTLQSEIDNARCTSRVLANSYYTEHPKKDFPI